MPLPPFPETREHKVHAILHNRFQTRAGAQPPKFAEHLQRAGWQNLAGFYLGKERLSSAGGTVHENIPV